LGFGPSDLAEKSETLGQRSCQARTTLYKLGFCKQIEFVEPGEICIHLFRVIEMQQSDARFCPSRIVKLGPMAPAAASF